MKLSKLRVDNFKAAVDLELDLSDMTALVGVNGSGKTTILEALDHFFRKTEIPPADYRDRARPITISVKFNEVQSLNMSPTITRTWRLVNGRSAISTNAEDLNLSEPDYILKSVHVTFEHAEHETDDDGTDRSDLKLVEMIREATRGTVTPEGAPDLHAQIDSHFGEQESSIARFKDQVNLKLRGGNDNPHGYAPDAEIHFSLRRPELEPKVFARFVESGTLLDHRSVGHGTKRAYHMAAMEAFAEMAPKESDHLLLLLVDEPELHQHPQRQRRILQTYRHMSKQPHLQVVYSTHSQEFVDLGRLHGLYRVSRGEDSKIVANRAPRLPERVLRWNTARKLVEGLFSAGVILVEGWEDKAILDGAFSVLRAGERTFMKKFIEHDINIINCHGKDNMPDFVRFFDRLGIPVFAAWDADGEASDSERNKRILDAIEPQNPFPAMPCSECHPGGKYVSFGCDACLYFRESFGHPGTDNDAAVREAIKVTIKESADLRRIFDTAEFKASPFALNIATLFHNRFFPPS